MTTTNDDRHEALMKCNKVALCNTIQGDGRTIGTLRAALAHIHAAVRGVRDDMETCIQGIKSHHLRGWANAITAALDAAPAPGDGAAEPFDNPGDHIRGLESKVKRQSDVLAKLQRKYNAMKGTLKELQAPAPVGIDPADVANLRNEYHRLKINWARQHGCDTDIDRANAEGHSDAFAEVEKHLTALIDAAGEQGPMVPVAVVDEFMGQHPEYIWYNEKLKTALAPHRPASPAASEPVCETCEDKHTITCDDYRECINPEKCAWGKVCKDGVFPCPDCATAPRTPTTEQRAAFLHKSGGYYNRAVTIIANVFSGNRDTEVTAWLAEREGGGE